MTEEEIQNFDINSDLDGDYGYIVECDLSYPKKLHKLHNAFPLAPEVLEVNHVDLSPFAKSALLSSINQTQYKDVKLLTHFGDRINYVVQAKNLKHYLDLGMNLTKIHKIITYKQEKYN
ncbi:MAG: hypothetical protein Q8O89_07705, partial [Nanoarchaeota archaeon]|nr:hypothetical protein [Nanoarchaeota archaeon]